MEWLLTPDTVPGKFFLMFFAILLPVAVMAAVLFPR